MEAPLDPNAYVVPAIVFICIASLSLLVYLVKTCTPRLPRPMALPLLPFRFRTRQDVVAGPKYGSTPPASSDGEDEEEDEDTPKITQRHDTPSRIERGDGHDDRQRKGHVRMPTDAQIVPLLPVNSRSRSHAISVGQATPNHRGGEERDPPFTVRVVGRSQGEEDSVPLLCGAPEDHGGIRVAGPGRTPGLMSRSRSREADGGRELSVSISTAEGAQKAKGRNRSKSIVDSSPPDAKALALEKERQRERVWNAQRQMTDASSRKSVVFEQTPKSKSRSRSRSRSEVGENLAMGMDVDMDEDVVLETPTQRPLRKLRSRRTGHPSNPADLLIASGSKSRSRSTLPFEDEELPTPMPLQPSVDPLRAHALSPTSTRPLRSPSKSIQSPTRAFAIRSPTKPKSLQRQLAQMPMERSATHHHARPLKTGEEKEDRVRPSARRALTDLDSLASPPQILSGDFDRAISFGGRLNGQGSGPV